MRRQSPHLIQFEVSEGVKKSHTQSGIWETGILCSKCDGQIGEYDRYAYSVLPASVNPEKFVHIDLDCRLYPLGLIDVERFKLFLVSLVWRAGVARDLFFQYVELGPYEERLREALVGNRDSVTLGGLTAVIALQNQKRLKTIMLPPFRSQYEGVNTLRFYLYPWVLIIKIDRRPFWIAFDHLALKPGREAFAIVRDDWSVGEMKMFADVRNRFKVKAGVRR